MAIERAATIVRPQSVGSTERVLIVYRANVRVFIAATCYRRMAIDHTLTHCDCSLRTHAHAMRGPLAIRLHLATSQLNSTPRAATFDLSDSVVDGSLVQ